MSTDKPDHNTNEELSSYYREVPSGYQVRITDNEGLSYKVEPVVYQPTALGAGIIASYYKDKYDINLDVIDQQADLERGDELKGRFRKFKETYNFESIQ